jgi:hypothetical protein
MCEVIPPRPSFVVLCLWQLNEQAWALMLPNLAFMVRGLAALLLLVIIIIIIIIAMIRTVLLLLLLLLLLFH